MKKSLIFSVLCGMCLFAHAAIYTPQTVINPKTYGQEYYVSNADGILSPAVVENINQLCRSLNQETKVELAVVAIDGYDETQYDDYNFAINLFNYWGIGDKKRNNGILVFLAPDVYTIRILTGSGIDNILTDDICGDILSNNMSYIRIGNYNEGMTHIVSDIVRFCMQGGIKKELTKPLLSDYSSIILICVVLILCVGIGVLIFMKKKSIS